jgi:thioredoxin reductase (NADPH)
MQKLTLFGAGWCPNSLKAKVFLQENNIPFEYINVEVSKEATDQIADFLTGKPVVPTLVWEGKAYPDPDEATLANLLGVNPGYRVILYGADWCPDCRRAKAFLRENEVNFMHVDVDKVPGATEEVTRLNSGKRIIPTIIINGEAYSNPDNTTLRRALGLPERRNLPVFDVAVIGGGAAGLTTAIYAQRDRFDSIVLEKKNIGGNAFLTETIENYPGFQNISGPDLMTRMAEQAETYGSKLDIGAEVRSFHRGDKFFTIAFIFSGLKPNTGFLKKSGVELDEQGFIATGPGRVETNIEGVFAAGDCRQGAYAQVAAATGEGVMASYAVRSYLNER